MMFERVGDDVRVFPVGALRGEMRPIGSKSLTNRALLCAALADGTSTLRGASLSDDAFCMIDGLRTLGVRVDVAPDTEQVTVAGGRGQILESDIELDAGNAGTAMRFLTPLACLGTGRYTLDGSPRMRERPIGVLVDTLRQLGAGIGYAANEGYPPLTIAGHGLTGGEVQMRAPQSSQFVSAVLMVAPYAAQDVMLRVEGTIPSQPYVDMTLALMRSLGVESVARGSRFIVPSTQRYRAGTIEIEPDASAATYFWAAAAITGGAVRVVGLHRSSCQGDVAFTEILSQMGCTVSEDESGISVAAPPDGALRGVDVDLNAMPDTVQTLAAVAMHANGVTTIRNVANLRIKETDRIAALEHELTRLGARVDARPDGLAIDPPTTIRPADIATYEDHRMAMSLALVGLAAEGVVIRDARCVSKSYPAYFADLGSLQERGE